MVRVYEAGEQVGVMNKPKFKKGDRVRVVCDGSEYSKGDTGVVVRESDDAKFTYVLFHHLDFNWPVTTSRIERAPLLTTGDRVRYTGKGYPGVIEHGAKGVVKEVYPDLGTVRVLFEGGEYDRWAVKVVYAKHLETLPRVTFTDDLEKNEPTRTGILREAESLINGDRQDQYGPPSQSFSRIAAVMTQFLGDKLREGVTLEPHDVALFYIAGKGCRAGVSPDRRDTWVDLAGFAALGGEVAPGG